MMINITLAILMVAASANAADQAEGAVAGLAYQYPTSHVNIISVVFLPLFSSNIDGSEIYRRGCVAFTIDSSSHIASIAFTFWPKRFPDDQKAIYTSTTANGPPPSNARPTWACALTAGSSAFVSSVR